MEEVLKKSIKLYLIFRLLDRQVVGLLLDDKIAEKKILHLPSSSPILFRLNLREMDKNRDQRTPTD